MGVVHQKKVINLFLFNTILVSSMMLPHLVSSTQENHSSTKDNNNNNIKMNGRLMLEIRLHGFLLWASMGFLMPLGILAIRISNTNEVNNRRSLRLIFYLHAILQKIGVLVATAGAIMSIKNFNNLFNNNHQRVGVALYGIIWLQLIIGIFRPRRGSKRRSVWFFLHWIIGTTLSLLGILNVYIGLQVYHEKTSKSTRLWNILFTSQVVLFVLFYLFQDKWVYIQNQGMVLSNEQLLAPSSHQLQDCSNIIKQKDPLKAESC